MADYTYGDYPESGRAPLSASVAAFMNWAGAVMSLALVAGLGVWGYQLLMRDVTGVPVVRALEGPMRIAPDNPGGDEVAFQGLAVNRIAAEGTAEDVAERVVLAPPATDLAEEDRAMSALLPDKSEAPMPSLKDKAVSATDLAVAAALAESPLVMLASASADDIPSATPAVALSDDEDGVARSPRPEPRPVRTASLAPMPVPQTGIDADPAAIAPGERLVQLGAFPTVEDAEAQWDLVAGRFGDFMDGKSRVIQEAEAGGKTFYRLRVLGFEDLSDSRRFCAVLVAGDTSCIPVASR